MAGGPVPDGTRYDDFFAAQDAAARRRRAVDIGFGACVLALSMVALLIASGPLRSLWPVALGVAALWACTMLVPAWLTAARFESGGAAVATEHGAVPVYPPSSDPAAHRLYGLVEEMALAAGLPVPDVHLLPQDDSINSMVVGRGPADAALVVTRGAAERLSRAQLGALIAHEFSHIQNGDMQVNLRLVAWVSGLAALHDAGVALWRGVTRLFTAAREHDRRRDRDLMAVLYAPFWLLAAAMRIVGGAGKFAATLLQGAVCRRHEAAADAATVRLLGDAAPLRELLLMAMGSSAARRGHAPAAPAAEHLWLVSHSRRLPRVHPPLARRIAALDPEGVSGPLETAAERLWQAGERQRLDSLAPQRREAREAMARAEAFIDSLPYLSLRATPDFVVAKVGQPDWMDVAAGEALRAALPPEVSRSVASPSRSRALVLAILASGDAQRWARQLALVEHGLGAAVRAEVEAERAVVDKLSPYLRLPAVESSCPGLRRLSRAEQRDLVATLRAMELEDGERELFELCLTASVRIGLVDEAGLASTTPRGVLWHAADALRTLLSVLAHHGSPADPKARDAAYRAGVDALAGAASPALQLPPNWAVALEAAASKVAALEPAAKRRVIAALTATVAHDGRLTLAEAELLRTLCAVLRCPLPPLMPEVLVQDPDAAAPRGT